MVFRRFGGFFVVFVGEWCRSHRLMRASARRALKKDLQETPSSCFCFDHTSDSKDDQSLIWLG